MSRAYLGVISIVTTATPLRVSTAPISPTLAPAIVTACPCPGVSASPLWNSAFSMKWLRPKIGTHPGSESRS
jgi:hypothetical protein